MAVTEAQRTLAFRAGRLAARTGKPITTCPYRSAEGGTGAALALWFVRGYRAAEHAAAPANGDA